MMSEPQTEPEVKVDVETLEACKRRLSVEAPSGVVRQAWAAAYGRVRQQARLPGFRKGHVPLNLVKLHFADDVRREVAQRLIPEVYQQALAQTQIEPLDEPDLGNVKLEEDAPLTFTATVEVRPQIALTDYKGLAVRHRPAPLTDEQVAEALERTREGQAEFRAVDRAPAAGDLVIIDYTLTPEGLPSAQETGYAFLVGDGSVMPEIDQAVVGLTVGGEREVPVRFAADHRREDLRGKAGIARVKLSEVKEKILPALDDDFARSLGDYATLAALTDAVRKQLERQHEQDTRRALEDAVAEALLARHEFAVPEALVTRQIAHVIEHMRERMRRQNVDPDRVRWDYGKLAAELRPGAERAVRRVLLLDAVAAAEGLAPSDTDVDREIEALAAERQRSPAAIRGMMDKSGDLEGLRLRLRESRALDFLIRHAAITA
jgi:trigger factor